MAVSRALDGRGRGRAAADGVGVAEAAEIERKRTEEALRRKVFAVVLLSEPLSAFQVALTQVLVIRSGPEKKGAWTEERVNVLENYKKFFVSFQKSMWGEAATAARELEALQGRELTLVHRDDRVVLHEDAELARLDHVGARLPDHVADHHRLH